MVEIEQDDKTHVFPAQVSNRDYSVLNLNQGAPRAHRREFYNVVKKTYTDYFDGRDAVAD